MRKIARISALVLCVACFLMLAPKSAAYAQQEFELGDEIIYIDGKQYYLQEKSYDAQPMSLDPGGISSVKEQISYYYVETTGRTLVVFAEVIQSTSLKGTVLATMKQTTEWHYVYEESVKFISGSTECTYNSDTTYVGVSVGGTSYDSSGNGTYSTEYTVISEGNVFLETISTTCSIYGTIS